LRPSRTPFATLDEWQDAQEAKAQRAAQARIDAGLPPEAADPDDPMKKTS